MCTFGFKGTSTSQVIGARNEIMMDDYDGQMIFGDLVSLKLPDIRLTGEEKPRKTSPRKLAPTGDRTQAHCMTSVHAATCSTVVDLKGKGNPLTGHKVPQGMWMQGSTYIVALKT